MAHDDLYMKEKRIMDMSDMDIECVSPKGVNLVRAWVLRLQIKVNLLMLCPLQWLEDNAAKEVPPSTNFWISSTEEGWALIIWDITRQSLHCTCSFNYSCKMIYWTNTHEICITFKFFFFFFFFCSFFVKSCPERSGYMRLSCMFVSFHHEECHVDICLTESWRVCASEFIL